MADGACDGRERAAHPMSWYRRRRGPEFDIARCGAGDCRCAGAGGDGGGAASARGRCVRRGGPDGARACVRLRAPSCAARGARCARGVSRARPHRLPAARAVGVRRAGRVGRAAAKRRGPPSAERRPASSLGTDTDARLSARAPERWIGCLRSACGRGRRRLLRCLAAPDAGRCPVLELDHAPGPADGRNLCPCTTVPIWGRIRPDRAWKRMRRFTQRRIGAPTQRRTPDAGPLRARDPRKEGRSHPSGDGRTRRKTPDPVPGSEGDATRDASDRFGATAHAGRNASERYMRYSAYSVLWTVPRYALHEAHPFVEPRPSRVSAAHNGLCLQ